MEYVFQKNIDQNELKRLQAIEAIFDPATRRRVVSAGIKPGDSCLEVGAGAGSVMRWMAEQVGPSGRVTAVDMNTRFLDHPPSSVTVVAGDIRSLPLAPHSFDLIHARYVLVHIPEYKGVLDALWKALKPGGALVIEEPDFTAYRGFSGKEVSAFLRVHESILRMFEARGVDPALGSKLPALFQTLGAKDLEVENDAPLARGGAAIATMMSLSAASLKEKYLATGKVTPLDLEAYERFAHDPEAWAIYYATIGATGRK